MEEVKEETDISEKKTPEETTLSVGYVVGLTKQGEFVFQVVGDEPGLVQLLGLHEHARRRLDRAYEQRQGGGDTLILELGKIVLESKEEISRIANSVAPKKPANSL